MSAQDFSTYVAHLDTRIHEAAATPHDVRSVTWIDESTAEWRGEDRYVRAGRGPNRQVAFFLQLAAEQFPYDRFVDDMDEPDMASTTEKIVEFFCEAAEPIP